MISVPISQLSGMNRTCSIGQIAYMDFTIKEAKIRFDVTITTLNITKQYWTHISNANRVNEQGIMITKELTDLSFVEPEILEEGQTIEQLKQDHYDAIFTASIPEFDFWWENAKLVNLEESLKAGILLLDSHGFYNPKQSENG